MMKPRIYQPMTMTFHPDVDALFALMKSFKSPPIHTLPVAEARAAFARGTEALGGPVVEMAAVEDLEADGAESKLPIRIYRPHGLAAGPAPALIFFHGGGWTIGSIETHDRVCRNIAAQSLCAVISVEYRLAPEHPLPAAPHDAIAAVAWLHANAASLSLDPARFAVCGDSAGGVLAAVTAIAARDAGIPLRAQVLLYPSADSRPSSNDKYPSRKINAQVPMLDENTKNWFTKNSLPDRSAAEHWHVSPIVAPDLTGVAPTLMVTAERDILHDEAVIYAARLEDAGVEVMRRNVPGMVHGFVTLGAVLSSAGETIETIAFFLKQRLLPIL